MPKKPTYSKEFWTILFQKYYNDDIIDLATKFTKNGTLKIGFSYLKTSWAALGETTTSAIEFLIDHPVKVLNDGNEALQKFDLPNDPPKDWEKAHVEISGFKPVLAVRDLRHEHLEIMNFKPLLLKVTLIFL